METMGMVYLFAGDYVPTGYALCNGQELEVSNYMALFTLLGTMYGGDGIKTFNLPNLPGPEDKNSKTPLRYLISMNGQYPMRS